MSRELVVLLTASQGSSGRCGDRHDDCDSRSCRGVGSSSGSGRDAAAGGFGGVWYCELLLAIRLCMLLCTIATRLLIKPLSSQMLPGSWEDVEGEKMLPGVMRKGSCVTCTC